jgi:hypothetical protein
VQTNPNRRKFYIIAAAILIAVIGTAVLITAYVDYSYVKIEVVSNSSTTFVVSYDSTSVTLTPSENATVEVLPHANVTVTATIASPSVILRWDVSGATPTQKGPDAIYFVTGDGGTTIQVSVELGTNSSG